MAARSIHARRRLACLLMALALGAFACAPDASESTFELTLGGFADVDPLPVGLIDRTGLVTSVDADIPVDLGFRDGTIVNSPGDADVLLVTWLGGMCDIKTTLLFETSSSGFRLAEHTEARQGGCLLAGIGRTVAIHVRSPVAAETVTFQEVD